MSAARAGLVLALDGLRVVWDLDALGEAARAPAGSEPEGLWRVEGQLDAAAAELLRVVGAGFEDGRALGVAAVRPVGAAGHGDERARAVLRAADGEVTELTRVLLSTEYDAAGLVRRAGLELYAGADDYPLRVSADGGIPATGGSDARPRELVPMRFRLEGVAGAGAYEIVRVA